MVPEICSAADRIFCDFGLFFPFYHRPLPPNNPKNQNLEIIKIAPGEIIILQNSTTNGNHMMYGSSDMERIVGIY